MEMILIMIAITVLVVLAIYYLYKKQEVESNKKQNNQNAEPTKLEIYNEIIGLRNQVTWTNIWLCIICIILICRYVLPFILGLMGVSYAVNEINSILNQTF